MSTPWPYLRLGVARPEPVDGHAAEGDADGAEAGDGAEQEEEDHAAVDDVVERKDDLPVESKGWNDWID